MLSHIITLRFLCFSPNLKRKTRQSPPVPTLLKKQLTCLILQARASPRKHSLFKASTAKNDQEASRQKRSRSEWVELHFETLFFKPLEMEKELAMKIG
jgi:hypothetical protein